MSIPDFKSLGLVLKPVPKKPGWFRGPVTDWQEGKELAARLRVAPAARELQVLVGFLEGDKGHHVYVIPPGGSREIVEAFRVGERCEISYGYNADETIELVATRLEAMQTICPFVVTFADSAGLHAEFTRKLTKTAATKINALYPMDDATQSGLEGYMDDMAEEETIAPRLVREQSIQLWWD